MLDKLLTVTLIAGFTALTLVFAVGVQNLECRADRANHRTVCGVNDVLLGYVNAVGIR